MNNRFLLLKCLATGALSFPTPFFIAFFLMGIDPGAMTTEGRFLLISILLLSGAVVGLSFYYRDKAIATLKDWYPSEGSPK